MPPACVRPANFDKLPTALQGYFTPAALLSIQNWFFSLTPAVCADWLASTPASGTEWHLGLPHPGGQALERLEDRAIPILPDDRLQYSIAMRNYPFPFGTLAAELDCQLCAQEGGLDQIIDGIAEQNVAMFRNYYAQAHEEREAAWREIKERWRHYNQSSQAMETGKHE